MMFQEIVTSFVAEPDLDVEQWVKDGYKSNYSNSRLRDISQIQDIGMCMSLIKYLKNMI